MFLIANKLLSTEQHGFLSNKSCITYLIQSFDLITYSIDKRLSVDVIYTDFFKAFDKNAHSKLLINLEAYGISGILQEWIKDFLIGSVQRAVLGNVVSNWSLINSGIPQRCIFFINDLSETVKNKTKLCADDRNIFLS